MIEIGKGKSKDKTGFSQSLHSYSAPRKNTSFNIGLPDRSSKILKAMSNSCSSRNSPFYKPKFNTIHFNSSFRSSE